ncbi:MAG TPA: xylulokinase [Oscillospiraceae bacterium]|nr:xylulokinase [Oscillospiraceae bacterium]HPS33729.1 xylulokinase [Oscillospiraceae bacterium]
MYLLGIDIGTSATKTVLFTHDGKPAASASAEYPLYQPKNGWAEQDPADWWNAVGETVKKATAGIDTKEIDGVGLSGQMHGLVLLDKEDRVMRRSIIWCDQRTGAQAEELNELLGEKALIEITANPALTGFTAAKILWVKENEPQVWAKVSKIMLPKDYIRYMLTGEFATEVSDAGGMQLLDVPKRRWSERLLKALEIDEKMLPKVFESIVISGKVNKKAAERTGLEIGTPVAGGGGDQAAGAIGSGIVKSGAASCALGSSGVVFAVADKPLVDPKGRIHTLCHAIPDTWHVMGVAQASGLSLKWLRDNFFTDVISTAGSMKVDPYYLMDKMAEKVPAGADGLIYLPYLMGERTPHRNPDCRGVFFGLSAAHGRAEMIRSVLEGVAFSLCDSLSIIRDLGIKTDFVRVAGGGAKSALWKQIIADCFDCELRTLVTDEGPALGVALLAGVGSGIYKSIPEACEAAVHDCASILPNPGNTAKYSSFYGLYQRIYRSLEKNYKELAEIEKR